ncbi:hypothetical protein BKA93DRAFT_37077 [Sparassis latifolia]
MAGANYMGGKRNAAKARVKDATGRAQRNHFGKQKLSVLSTGLCKLQGPRGGAASRSSVGASGITLAHAQRYSLPKASCPPASPVLHAFVESPVTPPRQYDRLRIGIPPFVSSGSTRSGTTRNRKSRILSALDTSAPIFLRAEMDRIRSIPDLAGLPDKPQVLPPFSRASKCARSTGMPSIDHDVLTLEGSSPVEPERKRNFHPSIRCTQGLSRWVSVWDCRIP